MGGETSQAWRAVLDDLVKRGLRQPEFLIVDGGTGLEQALAALWGDVQTERCTVHKHRNLLATHPRLHDEVSADYNDMIYAALPAEIEQRRRAFLGKWLLKCKAVADSLRRPVIGSLPSPAVAQPMEERSHHQRDRTAPRVETSDQNPDGAAVGRDCSDVVLGTASPRRRAQSGRMAEPDPETRRSAN